jgi:urease accessory protein
MEMRMLSLLQLSDPTLPIGGYAHSGGLETYVQSGIVHSRDSARDYIRHMLTENIRYGDAAFASLAYEAVCSNDVDECIGLDTECTALKLPREIREASAKLGNRLLKVFQPCCAKPRTGPVRKRHSEKRHFGTLLHGFRNVCRSDGHS